MTLDRLVIILKEFIDVFDSSDDKEDNLIFSLKVDGAKKLLKALEDMQPNILVKKILEDYSKETGEGIYTTAIIKWLECDNEETCEHGIGIYQSKTQCRECLVLELQAENKRLKEEIEKWKKGI